MAADGYQVLRQHHITLYEVAACCHVYESAGGPSTDRASKAH